MQLRAVTNKPFPAVPVVPTVLVTTVITAWLALLALERSPYGQLIGHGTMHGSAVTGESGQDSVLPMLAPFTAGWILMVVAMMLPVAMPLVMRLATSSESAGGRARILLLLPLGYVLSWTAFGVGAYLPLQAALGAVGPSPVVSLLIGPAALVLAGAYQFSPLKRRSVHMACTPDDLVALPGGSRRWARILALGAREGAVCIGCCWALMLLMLVGSAGGSGGMLVLGIIMYAEKNMPWGGRLVMPLGLFLIGLGLMFGWGSLLGVLTWHHH